MSHARAGIDVQGNRATRRYTRHENTLRVLWALALPLFSLSPRPLFTWRAFLLRAFGARLGRGVHTYPSTRVVMPWNLVAADWASLGEEVFIYNLGQVTIGARATVSLRAFLCAGSHDYSDPAFPLVKHPVVIAEDAWVCAGAYVGPGVTVGRGAVVAAQAVVTKDVEPWTVQAGNPAKVVGRRHLSPAAPTAEDSRGAR